MARAVAVQPGSFCQFSMEMPIGPKVLLVLLVILTAVTTTVAAAVGPYDHCWRWGYCCVCWYCFVYSLLPSLPLQLVFNIIAGSVTAAAAAGVGTVAHSSYSLLLLVLVPALVLQFVQHHCGYCCCCLCCCVHSLAKMGYHTKQQTLLLPLLLVIQVLSSVHR